MRRPSSATPPNQHGQDGQAVSLDARQAFADPNSGDVLTFSATNLPQGLSIDPATGLISGTLADTASRAGPYSVQVTATDDKGAATNRDLPVGWSTTWRRRRRLRSPTVRSTTARR